jgi:ribonuclease BN (tRNA processing enzyme)
LAFFAPAFSKGSMIRTWTGNLDGASAEATLERLFAPPLFPVTLAQFPARFEHHGFKAGSDLVFEDGPRISTIALKHPSGATGYRLENRGRSVCYVSDIEHDEPWPKSALVDFVGGCDLLIFDAMFTPEEYSRCVGWGHSTLDAGLELAAAAQVGDFAAFHHNPAHVDTFLTERERQLKAKRARAFFAREGMTLAYPPRKSRT